MGSGIVVELLRAGATVVAPLKDEAAVERLLADCSDTAAEGLFPVVADLADEAAAAAFFQDVASKHGSVDHAVSCFGSFWQGGAPDVGGAWGPALSCRRQALLAVLPWRSSCGTALRYSLTASLPCHPVRQPAGILTEQSVEEYRRMLDAIPTKARRL